MRTWVSGGVLCLIAWSGCKESEVARVKLVPTTRDVYKFGGGGNVVPIDQSADASDEDALVSASNVPLGQEIQDVGCKLLAVSWLPAGDDEQPSIVSESTTVCSGMPFVTLGLWNEARAEAQIVELTTDLYRVTLEADHLVPRALYSVWMRYSHGASSWAISPLGGLPNLIVTDDEGRGRLVRMVSGRNLRQGGLLIDAIATDSQGSANGRQLDSETTVLFEVNYHSRAQSNGNGTLGSIMVPPGRVEVPGKVRIDVHTHLVGSMGALP